MNHSLAAISSAVSACVAQLLKFFAKWQPIALVYFALHGFLRLKCHLQFSYGTVQYLRQQWPLRSCTLARCVIFLCNLNQQLWRSQFPQPKKLLRGEGEGCQRACHVCFSTAVLHETHETAASQWMCGAPARDVGKAKSYQSSASADPSHGRSPNHQTKVESM